MVNTMRFTCVLAAVCLAGCAVDTGVGSLYGDVMTVTRQGAHGLSDPLTVRNGAMTEARGHCTALGREIYVVALQETKPPYLLGNFPRSEVQFLCLAPGDPRLKAQTS